MSLTKYQPYGITKPNLVIKKAKVIDDNSGTQLILTVCNTGTRRAEASRTTAILMTPTRAPRLVAMFDTPGLAVGEERVVPYPRTLALEKEAGELIFVVDAPFAGHPFGAVDEDGLINAVSESLDLTLQGTANNAFVARFVPNSSHTFTNHLAS